VLGRKSYSLPAGRQVPTGLHRQPKT